MNKSAGSVRTGFVELDRTIRGLKKGELVCIAARPSMGKTALALNIVANVVLSKEPRPALFVSLEANRHRIMQRLIASEAKVGLKDIRTGFFKRDRWPDIAGAAERFAAAPLFIDDGSGLKSAGVRAVSSRIMTRLEEVHAGRAKSDRWQDSKVISNMTALKIGAHSRRLAARLRKENKELGLIVIDSIQSMRGASRSESRREQLSGITRDLKRLARDLNVPVIVLSRVGRSAEGDSRHDARPRASDLRESGALGREADVLAFIHREGYHRPHEPALEGRAEIIVVKNIRGGTRTVKMRFQRGHLRFSSFN